MVCANSGIQKLVSPTPNLPNLKKRLRPFPSLWFFPQAVSSSNHFKFFHLSIKVVFRLTIELSCPVTRLLQKQINVIPGQLE